MNPTWFAIGASLLGGGAVGAVITAVVTKHKGKRQPVTYKREQIEVFKHNPDTPFLQAALTLTTEEKEGVHTSVPIKNLSIEQITVRNTGNADLSEFRFGITLQDDNQVIKIQTESPDRHHEVNVEQEVSLENPQSVVDFVLVPFNREDEYRFTIHFIYRRAARRIALSTPHSSKLVEVTETTRRTFVSRILNDPVAGSTVGAVSGLAGVMAVALFVSYFNEPKPKDLILSPSDIIRVEQEKKLQQQIDEFNKRLQLMEQQKAHSSPTPSPNSS